jgi:hypothetical protein
VGEEEMNAQFWDHMNAAASIFAAAAFTAIALHPRIKPGAFIKAGLVVCVFALLASAALLLGDACCETRLGLNRAAVTLRFGLVFICIGIFAKASALGAARRKAQRGYGPSDTRTILRKIVEPVNDLADFFGSDWDALPPAPAPQPKQEFNDDRKAR